MRRIMLLLIALFLCGCSYKNDDSKERDSITKYESYLATLVEQDRFTDSSYYYDIEAYLNPLNDGTIRYDIIIEDPQVAMYDIEILAVESIAKRSDAIIYPCVGIFEEESYTMIPFQKNEEEGYVEAFLLSGISGVQNPVLNVLVTWTDYSKLNTYREFIKLFPTVPEIKDEIVDVVVE